MLPKMPTETNNTEEISFTENTNPISIRLNKEARLLVEGIAMKTGLNRTQIFELGICEIAQLIDGNFIYKGFDLKQYASSVHFGIMRRLQGKIRNEFLSSTLLILRIRKDIFKIIMAQRKNPKLVEIIREYIEQRKKESKFFLKSAEVRKEIANLEEQLEKEIPNIINYISNNIDLKDTFVKQLGEKKKDAK